MVFFIIQCRKIAEKFIRDEMTVYAAQASFFIVLSAFPFIMMLMTVVQLIPNLIPRTWAPPFWHWSPTSAT